MDYIDYLFYKHYIKGLTSRYTVEVRVGTDLGRGIIIFLSCIRHGERHSITVYSDKTLRVVRHNVATAEARLTRYMEERYAKTTN